jgi:hypothetical protein
MALSQEDLASLGAFIDSRIAASAPVPAPVSDTVPDRVSQVGKPDVDPEAGPLYYVHLADGSVVESYDSASTHIESNGKTLLVIGRYQVGE